MRPDTPAAAAAALAAARRALATAARPDAEPVRTLVAVLRAAMRRSSRGLDAALTGGDAVAAIRADPTLHHVAVWCRYVVDGVAAAAAELRLGPGRPPEVDRWVDDQVFVRAQGDLLAGATRAAAGTIALGRHLGLPVVDAAVDGRAARLIVDTGAPTTVISEAFAGRSALAVDREAPRWSQDGLGRRIRLTPAVASQLELGAVRVDNAPLTVMGLPDELGVDGILGPFDLLRGHDLVIDGPHDRLDVLPSDPAGSPDVQPEPAGHAAEVVWGEGTCTVRARVAGETRWLLLDTGGVTSSLCGEDDPASPRARIVTAAGEASVAAGGPLELVVGDGPAGEMPFLVRPCAADEHDVVPAPKDGLLGWPWFARRRVLVPASGTTIRYG